MNANFTSNSLRAQAPSLIALGLAMIATRMEHFGGAVTLPDASLGVFVLAGWLGATLPAFTGLLLLAAGIDYWAVTFGGVAADCFSPAYPALAIAYGALFAFGRWAQFRPLSWRISVGLVATLGLAFAISNLSFFWLSGLYPDMALMDYVSATRIYASSYVGYGVAYVLIGVAAASVFSDRRDGLTEDAPRGT